MTVTLQDLQPGVQEVIRAAQRFSASERLLLAKVLLDSVVTEGNIGVEGGEVGDESNTVEDEAVMREREAYVALHPMLLQQYPNEHVAIHNGELIDHDKDGLALSLRVDQRFHNEFVWIAPLKAQALEEWVIRSPRFEPLIA